MRSRGSPRKGMLPEILRTHAMVRRIAPGRHAWTRLQQTLGAATLACRMGERAGHGQAERRLLASAA